MVRFKHGYQVHDFFGILVGVGMSTSGILESNYNVIIMGILVMLSTLLLSPDLDYAPRCEASNRWEKFYLGWLWVWHGNMFKHRSVWSHFPGIASAIKFAYLSLVVGGLLYLLGGIQFVQNSGFLIKIDNVRYIGLDYAFFARAYVAVVISDTVHLLVDIMTTYKNQGKLFTFH